MRAYSQKLNKYNFNIGDIRGFLIFATVTLSFMYVYFVQSSVFNIVEREKISNEISTLSAKVSVLEANYITIRSSINIDKAEHLGFSEDFDNVNFANTSQGDVKGGLSYVNNEI